MDIQEPINLEKINEILNKTYVLKQKIPVVVQDKNTLSQHTNLLMIAQDKEINFWKNRYFEVCNELKELEKK